MSKKLNSFLLLLLKSGILIRIKGSGYQILSYYLQFSITFYYRNRINDRSPGDLSRDEILSGCSIIYISFPRLCMLVKSIYFIELPIFY